MIQAAEAQPGRRYYSRSCRCYYEAPARPQQIVARMRRAKRRTVRQDWILGRLAGGWILLRRKGLGPAVYVPVPPDYRLRESKPR